jgi:glucose-1-phosphate thymidylyltransferase
MKGIILSGGTGSRLYPLTTVVNKQLLPIFDKPMIYYPLSTLISCGIKDICIISSYDFLPLYQKLFGDGERLGLNFTYKVQPKPDGIAQSFLIAEDFIGNDSVCLILGDNVFHGFNRMKVDFTGAVVFAYKVNNPQEYGVVDFDSNGKALSIEEKPTMPKSKYAIPGLYFYDKNVIEYARVLKPSKRGEYEITDINRRYMEEGNLNVIKMPKGTVWLDAGSPTTLSQASNYIQTVQERQGCKIACIEEDCLNQGFIDKKQFIKLMEKTPKSEYRNYLESIQSYI